nr:xylulose kinase-1 [Tanacetum cinerariifolium]
MSLTFADTHNMVAYLNKSDASEGFNQVIDFLNGSYITYALTVNPTIYVTCIKQFWNTVVVKQSNDVTRLQALVDRKKVVITEAAIRDVLCLDDAEGVDCLPNEEIFAELARMGYEKPAKRTSWNEFSSAMTSAVICLSTAEEPEEQGDVEEQVQDNVDDAAQGADTAVSRDDVQDQSIPSPTPLTPPPQQPQDLPSTSQEALDACASLTRRVEHLEHDKVAQALKITKLKKRVKKLERANKVKVLKLRRLKKVGTSQRIKSSADTDMEDASNQGRMIADLDSDTCVALMDDEGTEKKAEYAQVAGDEQVKGRQAEIYQIDMDHASKVLSMQEDEPEVQETVEVEMDEEYTRKLHEELNKDIDWSVAIDHVKQKAKEDSYVQRYQVIKKRPQTEAQARRNMIMYLKNVAGFGLDYFKGMSYDDIPKRKKLNEEVEDLKQYLEIVPDEDDDVYIEAIHLLERRLRVIVEHSQKRFSTSKPNNFSDDYLLTTLRTMFKRPNGQDQVWKSQRSVHGQAKVKSWKLLESCGVHIISLTTTQLILLVERRYPLSRFTLDQMLNAVRLRVEEQSEMSLELLRFTRQQHQEGQLE